MAKLPKEVSFKITNIEELDHKIKTVSKLLNEIKNFKLKIETKVKDN